MLLIHLGAAGEEAEAAVRRRRRLLTACAVSAIIVTTTAKSGLTPPSRRWGTKVYRDPEPLDAREDLRRVEELLDVEDAAV